MHDYPDIPDYLRIPQAERAKAWVGRKLTKPRGDVKVTRNEDPSTKAFRREMERLEAEKKAQRFAMLKEMAAEKKRQGISSPRGSRAKKRRSLLRRQAPRPSRAEPHTSARPRK
jgi:hypothetical protein